MKIIVDELLTQYQLIGKGKLVVLLHGWGDHSAGLAGLSADLQSKYKVLIPDLPGFGGSQAPKSAWDLDDYAKFLRHLIAKLELPSPYAVIGHSNGGALAVRAISLGDVKAQKLVLLAAAGVRNRGSLKRLAFNIIAKTGDIATLWMPEQSRRALRKSLYSVAGSDMLVVPELQETFKKTVRQDVQADAASIDLPTLLVYAQNDRAVPLADGKTYARLIKNSRLEVIKDAGHFVHTEQPAQVSKLIGDFLK